MAPALAPQRPPLPPLGWEGAPRPQSQSCPQPLLPAAAPPACRPAGPAALPPYPERGPAPLARSRPGPPLPAEWRTGPSEPAAALCPACCSRRAAGPGRAWAGPGWWGRRTAPPAWQVEGQLVSPEVKSRRCYLSSLTTIMHAGTTKAPVARSRLSAPPWPAAHSCTPGSPRRRSPQSPAGVWDRKDRWCSGLAGSAAAGEAARPSGESAAARRHSSLHKLAVRLGRRTQRFLTPWTGGTSSSSS